VNLERKARDDGAGQGKNRNHISHVEMMLAENRVLAVSDRTHAETNRLSWIRTFSLAACGNLSRSPGKQNAVT
jgi:hypothetical protein